MNVLLRAVSAEMLKMKRTLALWMVLIAPMVVVVLSFLQIYMQGTPKKPPASSAEAWLRLAMGITTLWGFLMLPLFITLETALLGGFEHVERQWKQLFVLPVPRWTIYTAKLLVCTVMIAASTIVLWAGTIATGLFLQRLVPEWGISGAPPWWAMLQKALLTWLAAWLIISLQTWVSLRWRSFALAVGIGMSGTVIGFIVMQSEQWGKFYPWALPMTTMAGEGKNMPFAVAYGIVGGIVVGIIGCWEMTRRDVL
jgi:ABC-2 type transport system permease protein